MSNACECCREAEVELITESVSGLSLLCRNCGNEYMESLYELPESE